MHRTVSCSSTTECRTRPGGNAQDHPVQPGSLYIGADSGRFNGSSFLEVGVIGFLTAALDPSGVPKRKADETTEST
ncbi:hypothetical protein NQZ68_024656 [Dissostichus eleginoides]|nr:hypothetical protein NQZ68_024656 [Dissostichus eleginoides]